KRLLQTPALLGPDVAYTLLHTVAGMPEVDLRQGLARLQAAEFLYETRLFPDFAYTFKHALTHEVAYNSLLLERRRDGSEGEKGDSAVEADTCSVLEGCQPSHPVYVYAEAPQLAEPH